MGILSSFSESMLGFGPLCMGLLLKPEGVILLNTTTIMSFSPSLSSLTSTISCSGDVSAISL